MKGSVTRRGKGSWRIKYEEPRDPRTGKRRTRYLTVRGTRADAERELRAALHKVDRGISIEPSNVNLASFLESWLNDVAPLTVGAKALERYRGIVRKQIVPPLGATSLQRLRPGDISGWLLGMIKEGRLSVRTIRHAHGVLRTALNYAASVELVERNVAALVRPPTAPRAKVRILGADEIAETLATLKGHSLYPIVALAMGTGARRGEIAALRWDDIDFSTASARIEKSIEQTREGIRVKVPKTEAGWRTVSLPAIAVDALREHRRHQQEQRLALGIGAIPHNAPVFGSLEGDWPSPYSISDRWRDAVKNRNLPKVTFHALRHSHASALIAAGLDVVAVSRRLGHASPALTLNVYGHLFSNNDQQAVAAIDAAFAKQPGANRVPTGSNSSQ